MKDNQFRHILAEAKKQRRSRWFPSKSEREITGLLPLLARVNELEPGLASLEDDRLAAKAAVLREKISRGAALDDLLPEAFALVREAARRKLNMRHFDVQILGGIILFQGRIAEMSTGEGKTLVATLPLFLRALEGKGAHLVTVNDYLARRDRAWMGPVFETLGLTVGAIQHESTTAERRAAYGSDITYGTNNEYGFDYLRDNMVLRPEDMVQRELHYAIVDEVDNILIDEARTPLIISGPAEDSVSLYYDMDKVVRRLMADKDNYEFDEKAKTVNLTEAGQKNVEKILGIGENDVNRYQTEFQHYIDQSLKAHIFFRRDQEYLVRDGQVVIVDEFTGRAMPGRRFSDGLHQALEAKEGVKIEAENQTLASISFQNYFRLYRHLAGMTGTAYTEVVEFKNIYGLDVVCLPTNRSLIRREHPDRIYKSEREKFDAISNEIEQLFQSGQPVLVGTISIEKSERLSHLLTRRRIPHQVLNAKQHEKEAGIVAEAGRRGRVTIATNMAGRGTDIVLGGAQPEPEEWGDEHRALAARIKEKYPTVTDGQLAGKTIEALEVVLAGGLQIIGTERHEARRIDNQLRGRSGRQGDPGESLFFLSMEDDLLRIFGSERVMGLMSALPEGEPISNPLITRMIEKAQLRMEGHNFEIRKQLVDFDDVMNLQRKTIYAMRRQILEGEDLSSFFREAITEEIAGAAERFFPPALRPDDWQRDEFCRWFENTFRFRPDLPPERELAARRDLLAGTLSEKAFAAWREKRSSVPEEVADRTERYLFLYLLDSRWKSHLRDMDGLREGVSLRAYGQRDPIIAYKTEGFALFAQLQEDLRQKLVNLIFNLEPAPVAGPRAVLSPSDFRHERAGSFSDTAGTAASAGSPPPGRPGIPPPGRPGIPPPGRPGIPPAASPKKAGRNAPCPCGSGKKFKKCCGKNAA